ncbi:MAG: phage terminase large subunit [Spirochaetes bacterium]|nr:phage terminase large subunit [Spirochaetota bacterium]
MKENKEIENYLIQREFLIREARKSFFDFCHVLHGYKKSWNHIIKLCDVLQKFYENKLLNESGIPYQKLMINMPPRHYKTRTLILFCAWILGQDNFNTIISTSYSDDLATEFSRFTRDEISKQKNLEIDIVYSDIFEKTKVQEGNASYSKWALHGQHFNYLGAGFGASITGKGGKFLIIDDEIKSYEEAVNEIQLEKKFEWYKNTFLSRLEEGGKQIICMTRWSDKDICGKLLADEFESKEWYQLKFEAYNQETDKMLCNDMMSRESYENKKRLMDDEIFQANYHQITVEKKGRLYQEFKEYDRLPTDINTGQILSDRRICFIDTADQGNDYLCAPCGIEYQKNFYLTDVICTREPQEVTETKVCEMLIRNNIKDVLIESNAGGRAFARKIEMLLQDHYKRNDIQITWFTQTENKLSRILVNASNVESRVFYPQSWYLQFPDFARQMKGFMRDKHNKNDDAPDSITGIIEMIDKNTGEVFVNLGIR